MLVNTTREVEAVIMRKIVHAAAAWWLKQTWKNCKGWII